MFSHNCVLSQLCPLTTAISCDHSGLSCSDDRSARLTVLIFMFSDNFSDSSSSGSSFSDPSSSGSFFSDRLLDWYDQNGRDLPWRTRGPHPDPYVVWISEIMLQQTTVRTVIPYFGRFMKRFPDIFSLAQADIDEVLFFWQGLGYYTRARKLHECAVYVATELNGRFPEDKGSLGKLPGIGPYTSSSIAALAFDRPEAVVDGNVIRVICRLFALSENAYDIRDEIRRRAEKLMPEKRAADYTSAILDLGATVCTPQHPDCAGCPVRPVCLAEHLHIQESLPVLRKPEKTHKKGYVFLIRDPEGRVLIRKRTEKGLLSGLTEFPWMIPEDDACRERLQAIFEKTGAVRTGRFVRHVFTHIDMTLEPVIADVSASGMVPGSSGSDVSGMSLNIISGKSPDIISEIFSGGIFVFPSEFEKYAFSTLMKKVIREAENAGIFRSGSGKRQTDLSDFSRTP